MINSREIRNYVYLWGAFFFGVLLVMVFADLYEPLSIIGFIIAILSFAFGVNQVFRIDPKIREQYQQEEGKEKNKLLVLYIFNRSVIFLFGLSIVTAIFFGKDVNENSLVGIEGSISQIEFTDDFIKMTLATNPNEYGIRDFKVPNSSMQAMERDLITGKDVELLIDKKDEKSEDDYLIQIYGIRSGDVSYLELEQVSAEMKENDTVGYYLGGVFSVIGLIYLSFGRINKPFDKLDADLEKHL